MTRPSGYPGLNVSDLCPAQRNEGLDHDFLAGLYQAEAMHGEPPLMAGSGLLELTESTHRHRVEWIDAGVRTVCLATFYGAEGHPALRDGR